MSGKRARLCEGRRIFCCYLCVNHKLDIYIYTHTPHSKSIADVENPLFLEQSSLPFGAMPCACQSVALRARATFHHLPPGTLEPKVIGFGSPFFAWNSRTSWNNRPGGPEFGNFFVWNFALLDAAVQFGALWNRALIATKKPPHCNFFSGQIGGSAVRDRAKSHTTGLPTSVILESVYDLLLAF